MASPIARSVAIVGTLLRSPAAQRMLTRLQALPPRERRAAERVLGAMLG